jgi:hypothetical protein
MSLAVQRFLAALVVDPTLFSSFRDDRVQCATTFGLSPQDAELISTVDLAQLGVFRDVIRGTRTIQFRMFFPMLAHQMPELDWIALLRQFHEEVCVKNAQQFADAEAFRAWVEARHPESAVRDLVEHDMAILIASGDPSSGPRTILCVPRAPRMEHKGVVYALRRNAVPLRLGRSIDELQKPTPGLSGERTDGDDHLYLVHSSGEDAMAGLTVSELDAPTFDLVRSLYTSPWDLPDTIRWVRPPQGAAVGDLIEAGVLVMPRD